MRVLFLHNNFPAQYRHVAPALAADGANEVVFVTQRDRGSLPGVRNRIYRPTRDAARETHHYLRGTETAVLNGQAVWRVCRELAREGFVPDLVCAHSGWGNALYIKDVFPRVRSLMYYEWYYHGLNSDADFLNDPPLSADDLCRLRTRNASILMDLAACDWGISPTRFQLSRFPTLFRQKLSALHDGIDVTFFAPAADAREKLGRLAIPGLPLTPETEIVTYATRGMEPYRGFPQFMRAAARVLRERPQAHAVVVGEDRVAYGRQLPPGESWRQRMMDELKIDPARIHFTGLLPYPDYLTVLQSSDAHIYLTVPFVLSWSLLEAMATGCLVIGSQTAPVQELITDGVEGLLADFFDEDALAGRIHAALDLPERGAALRQAARRRIVEGYALQDLLPRHLGLIRDVAAGALPPGRDWPKAATAGEGGDAAGAEEKPRAAGKRRKASRKATA
ncbi:MAG: glycosyltransferase [Sneathiellaceae bacterium]